MESDQSKVYFDIGRIFLGIVFIYKAVELFCNMPSLDPAIPSFMGYPPFWVFCMGVIYGVTGISFIINVLTRSTGIACMLLMMLILGASSYRGFEFGGAFEWTALKFSGYFALMGGCLMVASKGQWWFTGCLAHKPENLDYFYAGRVLIAVFFFTAGWLHLDNIHGDAHALAGFPGAIFWTVFSGFCWIAAGASYAMNILTRVATLGVVVLVTVITFMINLRGFDHNPAGKEWSQISQVASNLGLIAGCLIICSRGHWWFHESKWWYPPKTWGFDNGTCSVEPKNDKES